MVNIKSVVLKTIRTYETTDVFLICRCLGVKLYVLDLGRNLKSHYLSKDGVNVLFINERLSINMRIFLCAHQLGHLILHSNSISYSTSQDKEADEFATEFLKLISNL